MTAALEILSKALGSAVESPVEKLSRGLLLTFVGAAIAEPASAVAAAIVKELLTSLLTATTQIERKLDALIEEPLRTAVSIVQEAVSGDALSRNEVAERVRSLQLAYDKLRSAESYAQSLHDERRREIVALYQCVVAAMMPGGEQYLRSKLPPVRKQAADAMAESREWQNRAETYAREFLRPEIDLADIDFARSYPGGEQYAGYAVQAKYEEHRRMVEAADRLKLLSQSTAMFCDFVDLLSEKRLSGPTVLP